MKIRGAFLTTPSTKEGLKNYLMVLIGSVLLAFGYVIFIVPHHIVPGGIFGLSIVLHEFGGMSIGMIALCLNIPLLLWGARVLGTSTGFKTAFSMVSVSVLVDLISYLTDGQIFVNDVLVSSVFGGVLIGLAVFVVMRAGATTGGNDILVRILTKWIKLPYTFLILIVDGIIVLLGTIVFKDFTMAAYCIIAIISISKTIEHFLKKESETKSVLIYTGEINQVRIALQEKQGLEENISYIYEEGPEKLMVIMKKGGSVNGLKNVVYEVDEDAYINLIQAA